MGFFTKRRRDRWRRQGDVPPSTTSESENQKGFLPNTAAFPNGDTIYSAVPEQVQGEFSLVRSSEGEKKRELGILNSLAAPICIVDRNGTILAVNQAWNNFARENNYRVESDATGNPEYGLGRNYFRICKDASGEGVSTAASTARGLREVLNGQRERYILDYPCHSPGKQRWYQLSISPIASDEGGAIIAHFNITEQMDLRHANEELDAFAQSLVLAFRTPLGSMRMSFDSLTCHLDHFSPEQRPDIENMGVCVDRLDSMVRDLLAYCRINRSAVLLRPTDLHHAIKDALRDLAREIEGREARIIVADSFPHITADPVLLNESISCLLSNALKFTTPGIAPDINIYAENRQEAVWLWIEDRGIGIDPKDIPSIFLVFRRGEGTGIYPGNGIGLAIVERSTKQMKASIEVTRREGGGSRFKLIFPKKIVDSR